MLWDCDSLWLSGKRPSTTKLSKEEFKSLGQHIEQHFDDVAPTNDPVAPAKKAKPKKQDKPLDDIRKEKEKR